MYGNPNYGTVEDVSIVLVGNFTEYFDYPAKLLQTQWGQSYPFNSKVPNEYPLGCSTIAAGQIMRYHQWPLTYDWGNITLEMFPESEIRSQFLYNLALNMGISFGPKGSTGDAKKSEAALKRENYIVTIQGHNENNIKSELLARRPIYMSGCPKDSVFGHAWVCDGMKQYKTWKEIRIMTLEYRPLAYLIAPMIEAYKIQENLRFDQIQYHMNWGWYGSGDGYFFDSNLTSPDGKTQMNYTDRRRELLIRPNK